MAQVEEAGKKDQVDFVTPFLFQTVVRKCKFDELQKEVFSGQDSTLTELGKHTVQLLVHKPGEVLWKPEKEEQAEEEEIKKKWGLEDVAISHRLGRLEIGEASLAVAVASPHRQVAFEACQYSVDRIKHNVPIWKKEYFEGGEVWVGSQEDSIAEEAEVV